jgi:glycosyltransferase involved in cell wall biosynthesis
MKPNNLSTLKIALVHDWLTGMRGGEKVLESLLDIFPNADIYTLLHNPGTVSDHIEKHRIYTSFIDHLPFRQNSYRTYLPLFPTAIEQFNFKPYQLIISTSHCVAKGIRTPPNALHISYVHSPMRYVWDMYDDYFPAGKTGFFSKVFIPFFANYLRIWDVTSSNRVDYFIANSRHVAGRIWKYYHREATVIHPPVDVDLFKAGYQPGTYYLIVSALVPYKRIDLAIHTFNKLKKELLVIGAGPEGKKLKNMARQNIKFLNWLPAEQLVHYYNNCTALIFPGEEDFGIVPVEAQACGKPVIAFGAGGVLESVIGFNGTNAEKCSGLFFSEQNEGALTAAIKQSEQINWNSTFIHEQVQQFSRFRFLNQMTDFIAEKWKLFNSKD